MTHGLLPQIALIVGTTAGMEGVAWATHRFLMHGPGWAWHKSHHEAHEDVLERNDLFALVFAALAILLFEIGHANPLVWDAALGVTLYGLLYAVLHDGLVHRRWPMPKLRSAYLDRLIQAHRLHHATHTRGGAVSFGFLYAPPVRTLAAKLRARRAA